LLSCSALAAQFTGGLTDPNDVPALPVEPVSRPGDLWTLGRHRLLCGDSTSPGDVERVLDGVSPHLMVTDPPYGVEYDPAWRKRVGVNLNNGKLGKVANDNRADRREAWELFPGSVAYVWHAGRHASAVQD
jgi:DNA modification methylase